MTGQAREEEEEEDNSSSETVTMPGTYTYLPNYLEERQLESKLVEKVT